MRAVHVVVPGDPVGSLALSFRNAQEMGAFAKEMLRFAGLGNNTICQNSKKCSPEQGKLNGEIAAFEALSMPPLEVSRVEAPLVNSSVQIAVPKRLGPWAPEGPIVTSRGKRPQIGFLPSSGKAKARVGVVQPWEKLGITKAQWEEGQN